MHRHHSINEKELVIGCQYQMVLSGAIVTGRTSVDEALLTMMRQNYHHLPIMDGDGPVGLVTAGDILRAQSEHPLRLVRDIHKKKSVDELLDAVHHFLSFVNSPRKAQACLSKAA